MAQLTFAEIGNMPQVFRSSVDNPAAVGTEPVGDTYRGIFSSWFNQEAIDREDWQRNEQSANNALLRDLYAQSRQNEWQSAENQKARDWEKEMRKSYYSDVVDGMKAAGINPVLAFSQGAGFPSSSSGYANSSSPSRSGTSNRSGSNRSDPANALASMAVSLVATLSGNYTVASSNALRAATQLKIADMRIAASSNRSKGK